MCTASDDKVLKATNLKPASAKVKTSYGVVVPCLLSLLISSTVPNSRRQSCNENKLGNHCNMLWKGLKPRK
jgi:hypothetical protein